MPFATRSLILLLLSLCLTGFAQTGNYFLSHYSPSKERFNYVCFDMAQDPRGIMYFATKAGILEFDGREWDLLSAPSAIYSLQISRDGVTYWAGTKGFGKVIVDVHGFQQITPLSDSTVSNVFQVLIVDRKVYFVSEEFVFVHDTQTQVTTRINKTAPENSFLKLFELFGVAYVETDAGVFSLEESKLKSTNIRLQENIIFTTRLDDTYIVGTAGNKVYSVDSNLEPKVISIKDQSYLDASEITSGTWVNRQLLAIGTLRGGVIFINPLNGLTEQIVNYSTGLPDNEVFATVKDANENIWVAHDYGFTRIAPYTPLRSFSYYKGLEGNLLCAYSTGESIYVGTTLGLFKLEKLDIFDELVYYVDVPVNDQGSRTPSAAPETSVPAESKKGGLFRFLKRKNKTEPPANTQANNESIAEVERPKTRRVKRVERIPRSSQYVYKRVQGIDAKVTHITEVKGRLLAAGLAGFFEVTGLAAKSIIDQPIRFIYSPKNSDFILVSTYNDEVRTLRWTGNTIENSSLFSNLEDQINYVFEGPNELWLCGVEKLYRTEVKQGDVRHKQTYELTQRNIDRTVGVVMNGAVILANADGFFSLDRKSSRIQALDTLPAPIQYFGHNGNIVFRDQHGWKFLGKEKPQAGLNLINVFDDIRFIRSDRDPKNLWLISGTNELYKFFGDQAAVSAKEYPLYLKSIYYQGKKLVNHSEIHMDQEHSSVKFKVVQPDYVNPKAIEFRYHLKGMTSNWSDWSTDNVIDIPYLPNGTYTLEVEARNILGKVSVLEPMTFEVLPPYWRRPWFYALEFSVFASLVMLSFRLSTRYRIVSRLLSLLTIILLIEFIQTVIGESILTKNSPVIDFFIQVVVALLILPVEGFLRKLMLDSLNPSSKLYQFFVPSRKKIKLVTKEQEAMLEKE